MMDDIYQKVIEEIEKDIKRHRQSIAECEAVHTYLQKKLYGQPDHPIDSEDERRPANSCRRDSWFSQ